MTLSLVQQLELEEDEGYRVTRFNEIGLIEHGLKISMVGFIEREICGYYLENIDNDRGEEVAGEFRNYFENLTEIPKEFEFLT